MTLKNTNNYNADSNNEISMSKRGGIYATETTKPTRTFIGNIFLMFRTINNKMSLFNKILIVLVIIALASSVYFYRKANIDPNEETSKEIAKTVKMVGRHLILPKDETPTMAIVSDPEKLKDQRFFINAKKGDRVLIYSQSSKAILYDPALDRVVEVAPVNLSGGQ